MEPPQVTRKLSAQVPGLVDARNGIRKLSTVSDNRSGRVNSLFTDPTLQRSTLGIPDALHAKAAARKGSDAFSIRKVQEGDKLTPPQDKDKETTGNRLLNMLRKTLQGSESEELEVTPETPILVPFGDVVGCLAIHIKNCRHFASRIIAEHFTDLFVRISVDKIVKNTRTRSLVSRNNERTNTLKFDEIKYFSVQVPRRQDDVRNNISLELLQHSKTENYPVFLGSTEVHLYEIIQKGCFTEELQILNKNTFICRLEVEFMFSYGNFGYGFSHQLKPLQKIIEPSMFMKIAPPPERTDPLTNVITPKAVEYPAFLSPELNVTVGIPNALHESNQPSVMRLEKLEQQPRERLEKMKKEYRNLGTWKEKADYLESILNPKLEQKESKEASVDEDLESLSNDVYEDKPEPENIATLDIPVKDKESEVTPTELLNDGDKEDLITPPLNLLDKDNSVPDAPESDESTPSPTKTPLPTTSKPEKKPEEDQMPSFDEPQSEAKPEGKRRSLPSLTDLKSKDRRRSILKAVSPVPSPVPELSPMRESAYLPTFADVVMHSKGYGYKNSNKKGKSVAFSSKEHFPSFFKPEYLEFKPIYQKFTKGSFDPFLRNINSKMSVRKRKDQEMFKCRNILSAEVLEHEDQDPPYPTRSKSGVCNTLSWAHDPDIIAMMMLDPKNKSAHDSAVNAVKTLDPKSKAAQDPAVSTMAALDTKSKSAYDPAVNTMKALDSKNKLKEKLPNVSVPNFRGESSMTGNISTVPLTKSLCLTPHIENLKQSMILKSILSKNLQDLSDKLFSKPEVSMNTEAIKKSSSPPLSIQDKSGSDLENKVLETIQDLNGRLVEKDIPNSKTLLNQVIKSITTDLLSKGKRGKSPEVEEVVSEKPLEDDETDFPMKRKSSFKKKHLTSEVSSPKSGLSCSIHDYIIKQIFTAPIFSQLEKSMKELSESQMNLQDLSPKSWETKLSSAVLVNYGEKDDEMELSQSKSVISQIIQAFPVDTLLESGIIKVMELDKGKEMSALVDTETASPEEIPRDTTNEPKIRSKTQFLSRPGFPRETTSSIGRVQFIEDSQNVSLQDSKYHSISDIKIDLPSNSLDREESDQMSPLEAFRNLLVDKLHESDGTMLKSFLKTIFNVFFKYNQPERRRHQPEKELERLIQPSFPRGTEHSEEIQGNLNKADRLERKPVLSPKLRVFLEELSESEVKNLKSELSKHIQHYLVERLSESGHITKEDLPKIYQNLYLMNEKAEPKGQNSFQEKYSETVKEIMSFVNKFNHHFIDRHLEIKLRSFLNEILQNYFLKNLSESSLFSETDSMAITANVSSLRTQSTSLSCHELQQDISRGSFGGRLEINMKYPLSKSLQNFLKAMSENELLSLKADLSKHLQRLFIEKLSKLGLMTERQLKGIDQHISLLNSSSIPLKYIKTDLPFRDDNYFLGQHSEKQSKYSKLDQKILPTVSEDKHTGTELVKKEENECCPLNNLKDNPSPIREQKNYNPRDGIKTINLIKAQPSNNNFQAIPLNKSSERPIDILLKKHKKEHGYLPFPRAETSIYKTEIQDPYSWDGKSKIVPSKVGFERTLKVKPFDRKENNSVCKSTAQEKPQAALPSYPRIPNCKMPREEEEYLNRCTFPSWQTNPLTHFNPETEEQSKLEQYCQRLKGNNNNNKKHLVTFAQYEREVQNLYVNSNEICNEKYANVPELQSFKHKENEKNSKPSFFPEVLKREHVKPKVQKERDHATKPKKSLNKVVRILPSTLPTTRSHLRKSAPRTLLHWTARRTIHDCSDRYEDLHLISVQHLNKTKSRARLLAKSPDDSRIQAKHSTRPYTAPEPNKRREFYTGKFASPRMVSSGLVNTNNTTPNYEIRKMRQKKRLKEDVEKCSLICDIIQMLNNSE